MKCWRCGKKAIAKNTITTRTGTGEKKEISYACRLHKNIGQAWHCDVGIIRAQEYGKCGDDV